MVDAGAERLVDDQLQHRRVADRQQLLGHRLGRRQEPGAHAGGGNDGDCGRPCAAPYRRVGRDCAPALAGAVSAASARPVSSSGRCRRTCTSSSNTGETIEVQQAFTDPALTEAKHPTTGRRMTVKKVFTPVGVTFRGDGFYKTDSRNSGGAKKATTNGDAAASTSDKADKADGDSSGGDAAATSSTKDADAEHGRHRRHGHEEAQGGHVVHLTGR